jgi:carboxymethylenebutenolidase
MTHGSMTTLKAADGHVLDAYVARPKGRPKGGLVILQEIFGLNGHMKHVADEYAADGYLCVAPAMFDRVQKNLVLGYTEFQPARDAVAKLTEPMLLADLGASTKAAAEGGAVVHIGYCWGGAIAYMAACKVPGVAGAVCYYGTRIIQYCETMLPTVPVQYHFGANDRSIPPEAITKIKAAHPVGLFYVYPDADHGFTCSERPTYNDGAKNLAKQRTLDFLDDVMS